MLKLFTEREELKVVDDQFVSPTWAGWLAEVLLDLARLPVAGVVHASCSGVVSWFDFAVEIQRLAAPALIAKMNGKSNLARLEKTSAFEFNRAAPRPVFSAFDTARLEAILRRPVLAWGDGLRLFLREIGML
jgi:dTDP-4-dehydrorhamnose reductase